MNVTPDNELAESTDPQPVAIAHNPLQVAWQRKSLVLLGLVIGLVGGILVQSQRVPVYQSTAQVLVEKKQPNVFLGGPGIDPGSTFYDDYVSSHLVVIKSPAVVRRAVAKRDIRSLATFAGHDPVPIITGSLTAARDAKDTPTNIINLSFRGPVSEDCPIVVEAVIEGYKDFFAETYRNVSDETLEQVNKVHDLLFNQLEKKLKEHREFREQCPIVLQSSTREGMTPSQARLSELETRRIALLMRGADIKERLQAIDEAGKKGTARELVLALAAAPQEKALAASNLEGVQQLLPLLLQEQALLEDYGDDHPQVKEVRRKLKLTREFLETSAAERAVPHGSDPIEVYVKALKHEQANINLEQQSLARLLTQEQTQSKSVRDYEDKDLELRTDITSLRDLLKQTGTRLEQLNSVRDSGGYKVQTIAPAGPGGRVSTPAMQIIFAGGLIGLLLGIGLAYLADLADKSFRNPDEIRRRLGLAVLAHVPIISEEGSPSTPEGILLDRALAVYHRPTSPEAESYRILRTALYFSTKGEVHKVIQITSPSMGDGKSTIAANLALAIAQSGKRVVLVDADLRRPRVHSLFGVTHPVGLSSLIAGEVDLAAVLVNSGIDNLSLVACGTRPSNPAELLTLPRFDQFVEELRQQFDFVIVDTPPLLAVTDPCVVVPRMDGVILTIRLGKNARPAAERAREVLLTLRAKILGVVVNAVGKAVGDYGYEYYSYGYAYGKDYSHTATETNGQAAAAAAPERKGRRKKARRWFARWLR